MGNQSREHSDNCTEPQDRAEGGYDRPDRGVPEATVGRLPVYLRALTALSERDVTTASSEDLAVAAGVNSAKLRKDLSYLGTYGTRGVGYDVNYLRYQIAREIGLTQDWAVVIVGIGNLGQALANYSGFATRGFQVAALLDNDPELVGLHVGELEVAPLDQLDTVVRESSVAIGVIATPAAAAQDVCDRLAGAGVSSILNFAPAVLTVPESRRRPQGRPLDRTADPRLPRAAQSPKTPARSSRQMSYERFDRWRLSPQRASRIA